VGVVLSLTITCQSRIAECDVCVVVALSVGCDPQASRLGRRSVDFTCLAVILWLPCCHQIHDHREFMMNLELYVAYKLQLPLHSFRV
jgi:hypothetical protein